LITNAVRKNQFNGSDHNDKQIYHAYIDGLDNNVYVHVPWNINLIKKVKYNESDKHIYIEVIVDGGTQELSIDVHDFN